jgi:hypothetical protein
LQHIDGELKSVGRALNECIGHGKRREKVRGKVIQSDIAIIDATLHDRGRCSKGCPVHSEDPGLACVPKRLARCALQAESRLRVACVSTVHGIGHRIFNFTIVAQVPQPLQREQHRLIDLDLFRGRCQYLFQSAWNHEKVVLHNNSPTVGVKHCDISHAFEH